MLPSNPTQPNNTLIVLKKDTLTNEIYLKIKIENYPINRIGFPNNTNLDMLKQNESKSD